METIQWTTTLVSVFSIAIAAAAAFGFITAFLIQNRNLNLLEAQLKQKQEESDKAQQQIEQQKSQLIDKEQRLHKRDVEQSRLYEKLTHLQNLEKRLIQQVEEQKEILADLSLRLEQKSQNVYQVEKKYETALSDIRALENQANDRHERLERGLEENRNAHLEINLLRDRLAEEGKRAEALDSKVIESRNHFAELRENLHQQSQQCIQWQEKYQQLNSDYTELKTTLTKREEHFSEQMTQLAETRQSLTKEFEHLAGKIFEEKGKAFTHTSQASINNMLKPFREQIHGFQKRINEVHESSIRDSSHLNAEIKKVLEIGLTMSKEANNLTSALKGDSQKRGAWGEAQLRRTLEMSGLVENTHFEAQSAFKDVSGKQKLTDYLIKLTDGKQIIIDSKVSLVAYDRAIAAENEEEFNVLMHEHIKAVRRHIDDLASKDYTNLVGIRSPSFVLMFMPIEPAYIEALKNNKDLFEYGYKKNVVLVSHTTLIPILRTVSNLWMLERSNAEAREISEKAGDIYNQVCLVAERLNRLGNSLNAVGNHYNNTVKALVGQQGLHGKVERFGQLSAKVSKTMPSLEPSHVDFENERLSLIVEPIEDYQESNEPNPVAEIE